jgi:tetratricopeptide (TPR) repeat protein
VNVIKQNTKAKTDAAQRDAAKTDTARAESQDSGRRLFLLVLLLCLLGGGWIAYSAYRHLNSPRGRFEEAVVAWENDDLAQVQFALEDLRKFDEYAAHCHYLTGALLLRRGKLEEALEEFQYSAFHPDVEVDTHVLVGQVLYRMGRGGEAADRWSRALSVDEESVSAHRMLAKYYYDLGAMQQSLDHLRMVSILDPQDASSLRLMGAIHVDYDRNAEAVRDFRESLRREPEQIGMDEILGDYAESQIQLNEFEAALEILSKASRSPRQLTLMAECQLNLGGKEEAAKLIEETLQSQPTYVGALLLKGRISMEGSDPAAAVQSLRRAAELEPKNYGVRFQLARALQLVGRQEEANKENEFATELGKQIEKYSELNVRAIDEPDNADLRVEIGELAVYLDKLQLAREWFQAALFIDPTHERARKNFEALGGPAFRPAAEAPTTSSPTK